MVDHESVIRTALQPYIKGAGRREEAAGKVYAALEEAGAILDGMPIVVEVPGSRVPVQVVEMFGLIIRVDANGRAVSVENLSGLEVTQYQEVTS